MIETERIKEMKEKLIYKDFLLYKTSIVLLYVLTTFVMRFTFVYLGIKLLCSNYTEIGIKEVILIWLILTAVIFKDEDVDLKEIKTRRGVIISCFAKVITFLVLYGGVYLLFKYWLY